MVVIMSEDAAALQVQVRVELEMARVKQMHQKELEDKEEELEDVHRSSQRRVRGRRHVCALTTLAPLASVS